MSIEWTFKILVIRLLYRILRKLTLQSGSTAGDELLLRQAEVFQKQMERAAKED